MINDFKNEEVTFIKFSRSKSDKFLIAVRVSISALMHNWLAISGDNPRIEFNNAAVSDIDLYDLISTVVSRELSIKRLEYDKDTSPIEKLLGLFMVEDDVKEIISKNIKSLEREITPNGVGIERDTTNIKLIKTLKKINEIK